MKKKRETNRRKMNKRGGIGDIVLDNVVYIIITALFFIGMFYFVSAQKEGADKWESYYAGEIVKVIEFSEAGDKICLDVHKATEIAKKNKVKSFSEIFRIDNAENEICVKLSLGKKTCYNYFNDVDIINIDLRLSAGKNEKGESVLNILCFSIVEPYQEEI